MTAPDRLVYQPALLGLATVHYASAPAAVDRWEKCILWQPLGGEPGASVWDGAARRPAPPERSAEPDPRARFGTLPAVAERKTSYAQWTKQLASTVYRDHALELLRSKSPKLVSTPGESEGAFRGRIADLVRDERDRTVEKLRQKYAPKLATLRDRIARANERVERETEQYADKRNQAAVSLGASLIGALFGRKLASATNVSRAASTIRGASRAAQERADIGRAEDQVEAVKQQLADLEAELARELAAVEDSSSAHQAQLEPLRIAATKGDLAVEQVALVWAPAQVGAGGELEWVCEGID
ncbi:MAG: hypothetical protein IPK00_05990 [Deltaproteobacteria bacterium]|nr:hypothetical protein [Deltaproteobacteria bacterium]